jgi:hypothetical protein
VSVISLGFSVDKTDSVHLAAGRGDGEAYLSIRTDGTDCEIRMDRAVVEGLRNQIPVALAGLDRYAVETEACVKANAAEKRAVDTAAQALDLAETAEQAGDHELAASLRSASATATEQASAVDAAVTAFEDAAVEAGHAADRLIHLVGKAKITLSGSGVR